MGASKGGSLPLYSSRDCVPDCLRDLAIICSLGSLARASNREVVFLCCGMAKDFLWKVDACFAGFKGSMQSDLTASPLLRARCSFSLFEDSTVLASYEASS